MRKAQAWSMDLTIGVIIFLLVVSLFYVIYDKNTDNNMTRLKLNSETIATKIIDDNKIGLIQDKTISKERIKEILNDPSGEGYEKLKQELGVEKDFCIFLEDEKGNLVNMTFFDDDNNYWSYTGIGPKNNKFNLSGIPCGEGNIQLT